MNGDSSCDILLQHLRVSIAEKHSTNAMMGVGVGAPVLLLGLLVLTVHCARIPSTINSDILRLPGPPLGEDFSGMT